MLLSKNPSQQATTSGPREYERGLISGGKTPSTAGFWGGNQTRTNIPARK